MKLSDIIKIKIGLFLFLLDIFELKRIDKILHCYYILINRQIYVIKIINKELYKKKQKRNITSFTIINILKIRIYQMIILSNHLIS